ncbi:hypothetical protein LshimejAT787_0202400 [Lyophyllum shimeji]|uniref:Cupredoxin n=1 Tax=Lyophyllum shimeji TaxID=47721 RepID=A0A9P3UKN0_LYOSH|nr:hypothetical protein LshimejAT787_0202400 [Lyophyllum shimeji]
MRFFTAVFALAAAAVASAANVNVLVGDGGALAFSPSSVTAAAGDTVIFEFRGKNHSVTQSTFANPCTPMSTPSAGVNSGFELVAANATSFPTWSITIDDASTPLWFFCAQTKPANHCQAGMVFAINPTAEKSFAAYQANAKASTPGSAAPAGGASATGGSGAAAPTGGTAAPAAASGSATSAASAADSTAPANGALRIGGGAYGLFAVVGLLTAMMV